MSGHDVRCLLLDSPLAPARLRLQPYHRLHFVDCDAGIDCREGRDIPYLHLHGTADPTVPYDGNGGGFKSVAEAVGTFRELNRCEGGDGDVTYQNGATTCISYCPLDSQNVTLCTVEDGGHVWFREENSGIEATAACVDFFLRHSRNGTAH